MVQPALGLLVAVCAGLGCVSTLLDPSARGLLPVEGLAGSLGLDVFFIERPESDPLLGVELWQPIDEHFLSPELRVALNRNGFRVGVVGGGQMSSAMQSLLRVGNGEPAGEEEEIARGPVDETAAAEAIAAAAAGDAPMGRHLILRKGVPYQIDSGAVLAAGSVLMDLPGQGPAGRSLSDARFLIHLEVKNLGERHAEIEFLPQVHHGPARARPADILSGGNPYSQDVTQFPELSWTVQLTPGQMLVMTMPPDCPQSLGWHFFHAGDEEEAKQRVIIVRLARLPSP